MSYTLTDFIISLATPEGAKQFRDDPESFMLEHGLSDDQKDAVRSGNRARIRRLCSEEMVESLHAQIITRAYREAARNPESVDAAGPTDVDDAHAETDHANSTDHSLGDDIAEFTPRYSVGPYYDHLLDHSEVTNGHSLVFVGSGITGANQFTSEALIAIQNADKVLYCVADLASEKRIRDLSKNAEDLYQFYADDKPRRQTYEEMVQKIMECTRSNRHVCVVFYGHPGIFVWASYRSIQLARREGCRAYMLPAVSALDCLFADVGFDPSRNSCQIIEATDMLVRSRQPDTSAAVVIFQAGCVGDLGYSTRGYDGRNVPILAEYLTAFYGPDHELIVYEASQYPTCPPRIERTSIGALRDLHLTGISTLYVPPKRLPSTNRDMLRTLGLAVPSGG